MEENIIYTEKEIEAREWKEKTSCMIELAERAQTQFKMQLQTEFGIIEKRACERRKHLAETTVQLHDGVKDAFNRFPILNTSFISDIVREHYHPQEQRQTLSSLSAPNNVPMDLPAKSQARNTQPMIQPTHQGCQVPQGSIVSGHEQVTPNTSKLARLAAWLTSIALSNLYLRQLRREVLSVRPP